MYPDEIRWYKMVKNLKKTGMSLVDIAAETGFSVSDLNAMEQELYEPPYLPIIKLLDLHLSRCPNNHKSIGVLSPEEFE